MWCQLKDFKYEPQSLIALQGRVLIVFIVESGGRRGETASLKQKKKEEKKNTKKNKKELENPPAQLQAVV